MNNNNSELFKIFTTPIWTSVIANHDEVNAKMNKYIKLSFLFILLSCGGNKDVFWCGDHACVNKAEKENYFKKNMIVVIKKQIINKKLKVQKLLKLFNKENYKTKNRKNYQEESKSKKLNRKKNLRRKF